MLQPSPTLTTEPLMNSPTPTALVTGASSGIGTIYAKRLAQRGHPLILVARDTARLNALATELRASAKVDVDVLPADLTHSRERLAVENRLREDTSIGLLVNNAGAAAPGGFVDADTDKLESLITLNALAVTRLTAAVLPGMLARGKGSIINIASVVGLAPEISLGIYGATKAFVIAMSQALAAEVSGKGIYVQAVLPAATRTEIWERSGRDVNALRGVMDVEELVDAALVGFDRREAITIPPLPDAAQWQAYEAARLAMLPNFAQEHAAERYRAV
jgi:short-subunit dehydrogenase